MELTRTISVEELAERLKAPFRRSVLEPLEREDEARRLAIQREALNELNGHEAEIASRTPRLTLARQKENEALEVRNRADSDLRSATSQREQVQFELLDLRGTVETLKSKIAQNCCPDIDTFMSEHLKLFDKIRNEIRVEERLSEPHRLSENRTPIFWTNKGAVDRTIDKIRHALDEATKLRNEILTDAAVKAKLDELRVIDPRGFKFETIGIA